MTIAVLHADDALVAVDKPAGRIVVPGRGGPERTVREEAEAELGPLLVVHRLDRGTSGVLLLARTPDAHRALCAAFEQHRVTKRYLALVAGRLERAVRVEAPLSPRDGGGMQVSAEGKPASTYVRPVAVLGEATLVEAFPASGRTHQVRVHLAHAGHPLLLDPDYGARGPLTLPGGAVLARTPLHAASLELLHPTTGTPLRVEAPLAPDLVAFVQGLRAAQLSKSG